MPVVCDFTVIQDGTVTIGDNTGKFQQSFGTGGRHNSQALLMVNVKGLTRKFAAVRLNGTFLKALQPAVEASRDQWFTQHMVLPSHLLSPNEGQNVIEIFHADNTNSADGGQFDDFEIRDVVCFFHQEA
jgi:hypothetical protein